MPSLFLSVYAYIGLHDISTSSSYTLLLDLLPFILLITFVQSSKLHPFHNMKFFTILSALGLVAAVAAQQTTHDSTVASSTLATSTSASLTPEQSCVANCKLQALLTSFCGC